MQGTREENAFVGGHPAGARLRAEAGSLNLQWSSGPWAAGSVLSLLPQDGGGLGGDCGEVSGTDASCGGGYGKWRKTPPHPLCLELVVDPWFPLIWEGLWRG